VVVTTPDINSSGALASLVVNNESNSQLSVNLGLSAVRGVSVDMARRIVSQQPYESMEHLGRCIPDLSRTHIEALATAGAFEKSFAEQRRSSLWKAGAHVAQHRHMLENITALQSVPELPYIQPIEEAIADLWATGISPDGHPTVFMRGRLAELGVITAEQLLADVATRTASGSHRVLVAGVVTHRQRPMTAKGATFISLEDETGLINVVCSRGCWARHRDVATNAPALLVRGVAQSADGAVTIRAESLVALHVAATTASRDFR